MSDVSRETLEEPTPIGASAAAAAEVRAGRFPALPKPKDTRIITVANQTGGVGKTTSTVNLAAALALQGQRILVIDLDPQGNASTALAVPHQSGLASIYQVLLSELPMAAAAVPADEAPNLWVVPATLDLAGAEMELYPMVAREWRLARALKVYLASAEAAGERFDFVFIDCPPSIGLLTLNAFVAAQELLIPIQCEYYALEGVSQLVRFLGMVRANLNASLHIGAILLTMFDSRTRLGTQVAQEVRRHFGEAVLRTPIPRSVRLSEAPGFGQTILAYDPGSAGAQSYLSASRELCERH
jgi:chromosome partitioning protein